MTEQNSDHSFPLSDVVAKRWSPRAYSSTHVLSAKDLGPCFEAARWSPSSGNSQPWSFVVGFRGDELFSAMVASMAEGNAIWATRASAVVANITMTHSAEGKALSHALYDLGQAVSHFSIQATAEDLLVHQMGGFNSPELGETLGLADNFTVVTLMTVGVLGDIADLSEKLQDRERAPRVRKPLSEIVIQGASY
jgi:nitroreductase